MGAELSVGHSSTRQANGRPGRLWGDERLAREVADGNERAFATLFQRYHQQLYRYCRSLTRDDRDAEDALQSALIKALVALREGRRNAPVRPWLYRIAHNESVSVLRSRPLTTELTSEREAPLSTVESVEQRERLELLLADLQELPERQRGALVMRELNGLSHEEIALALEVSVGAAKQTILEARRSLLEFTEGRAMPCEDVQRVISDLDRRSLRSRRVRAHLRGCARCSTFAAAIPQRRGDLQALCPMLPAAGAAGLLAKLTGAGSSHGGGGAGIAAGSAAKGLGAVMSIKAAATGAAVIATVTVGAVTVLHHDPPAAPAGTQTSTLSRAAETPSAGVGARQGGAHAVSRIGVSSRSTAPGRRPGRRTHTAATMSAPPSTVSVGHAHATQSPASGASPAAAPSDDTSARSSLGSSGHGGSSGHRPAGGSSARSHTPAGSGVAPGSVRGLTHASTHRRTTQHARSTVHHSVLPPHRSKPHRNPKPKPRPHRASPPARTKPVPVSTTDIGSSSTDVGVSTTTVPSTTAPTSTVPGGSPPAWGAGGSGGHAGVGSSGAGGSGVAGSPGNVTAASGSPKNSAGSS